MASAAGEVASRLAIDALVHLDKCRLDGRLGYVLANVGDSRTYLLREGTLTRLSRDDSYVQMLLDSGAITPDEARRHPQRSLVVEALDGDPDRRPPVVTTAPRASATACCSAPTGSATTSRTTTSPPC